MLSSIKKYIKVAIYDPITSLVAGIINNVNTGNNELLILQENHICTDNTTTTPLGIGETFTGDWQYHKNYQEINISIVTDEDSAVDGLVIEWSADAVIVADSDSFSIYADAGNNFTPNPSFLYIRLKYTNGGTAQTEFNLTTILRKGSTGGSFHRIDSTLRDDNDGRLMLSVPKLKTAADTYVSQTATISGNAKVSIEELESGISSNSNSQLNTTQYDSTGIEKKLDSTTGGSVSVDFSHHEIHEGDHFFNKDWLDLTNGQVYDILLITPNTDKLIHFGFEIASEAEFNMVLYSGTTTSANGTSMPVFNRNPTIGTANGMLIYHTPTVTNVGTQIARYKGGSGRSVGGAAGSNNEVVLVKNTKYLARITNDTVTNNWVAWLIDWYEHTNL